MITTSKSGAMLLMFVLFQFACGVSHHQKLDKEDSALHRSRRSTSSCDLAQNLHSELTESTFKYVFTNDTNGALSLTWSEPNILALTTQQSGIPGLSWMKSNLYISKDRGKTFQDISNVLDGAFLHRKNGLVNSPLNNKWVLAFSIDEIRQTKGTTIFITQDSGATWTKVLLPFQCDVSTLQFSPIDKNRILLQSTSRSSLWISTDFGRNWTWVNDYVTSASWNPLDTDMYYYNLDPTQQLKGDTLENQFYRASVSSGESNLLARDVHSFVARDHFLLLSVQFCGKNGSRVLYVSKNEGNAWNAAQVPMISNEQFYSMLDMNEDMIFLHVDQPSDSGHGDIYVSDERGIVFSKSLSRHLYPNNKAIHDFYQVLSMPGTYITSQLLKTNTVHTLITHDKGGEWKTIEAPKGKTCPATEKECKLQIHNYFSNSKMEIGAPPLSSKNTVGLILAHGNIGDGLSIKTPDVYLSRDGGYEWVQPDELKGPHHYAIGDSGGVLYALPYTKKLVNFIWFSLDEGQCWHKHNFTSGNGIYATGLLPEPGEKSTDITVWGYTPDLPGKPWTVFFIDFKTLLKTPCTNGDYEKWTAHNDNCVLGSKQSFMRRKKDTACINGEQLDVQPSHQSCTCTLQDYMCDFGYSRGTSSSSECTKDDGINKKLDICIDGEEEQIVSQKYRKIPSDKCTGGSIPQTQPTLIKKNCEVFNYTQSGEVNKFPTCFGNKDLSGTTGGTSSGSNTGLIIFLVLLSIGLFAGILYVVYSKRSSYIRVRYREFARGNGDDGLLDDDDLTADPVDTRLVGTATLMSDNPVDQVYTTIQTGGGNDLGLPNGHQAPPHGGAMLSYHDDSDEDLLMT